MKSMFLIMPATKVIFSVRAEIAINVMAVRSCRVNWKHYADPAENREGEG